MVYLILLLICGCFFFNVWQCDGAQRQGPMFIQEPPQRVDFANNSGVVITCTVHGRPTPSVSWVTRDGSPVNEIPSIRHVRHDGSLVFPPFRADQLRQDVHNNVYRCLATNSVGTVISRDVRVRGVMKQQYVVDVYDEFVIRGNTAVLRCHIPGFVKEYISVVSWIQDSSLVLNMDSMTGNRYVIFPTGELYIRNAAQSDAQKKFQCKTKNTITGDVEISSSSGKLVVTDPYNSLPPRINDIRRQVTGQQGQTIRLPCAAQGHTPPVYKWYKRDVRGQLTSLQLGHRRHQLDGILVMTDVNIGDSGIYVCVVNNSVASDMGETEVVISVPLSVSVVPSHQTVDIGRIVTMNCSISGYPVISVEWRKDSLPVHPGPRTQLLSRDVLRITSARRDDKGMYQCFASNEWDSAQGSSQLDLGEDPPTLLETFVESTLHPGPPLSLKCVATGNPLPQVTWSLDEQPIPEGPRLRMGDYVTGDVTVVSYVNLTSIQAQDGGKYQCSATNEVGSVSHAAQMIVFGAPFVRHMSNLSAVAGEILQIQCPVGGHPLTSIVWEREDLRLPYNHRQKVSANGSLVVQGVERATDEGKYTCIARNAEGQTAQNSLYVTVLVRPSIEPFSFPKSLHQGQRFNLLCTVSKGDPPVTIVWLKDDKPFVEGYGVKKLEVTEFSSTLAFQPVRPEHRGNYTCMASNPGGTVSHTATMVIHVPPRWKLEPTDANVIRGRTATIDCQADGFPYPQIRWTKAEGTLPSDFRAVNSNSQMHVFENGSLSVLNARDEDNGFYMCQATNNVGQGLSKVIKLSVHVAAHFNSKFRVETVRKESDAKLKCEAFGDRHISIVWMKDKQLFDPNSDPRYEMSETVLTKGVISELTIHKADRRDSALFTCVASNAFGNDDTNIQLIMQEPPDPTQDARVIEASSRSFRLAWTAPYSGNSPILQYIVQYKTESERWYSKMTNTSVPGSDTTASVIHLQPVTTYNSRVLAVNALGTSVPSQIINVKTHEEAPGGPPLKVKVYSTGSQSVHVTWKPPRKDLTYGVLRGYYVGYKIMGTTDKYIYKTVDVKGNDGNQECHIKHLRRATKYLIVVQAFNSKGAGPPSEEITVKTLDNDPPSPPTLRVIVTSPSTIQLAWDTNPLDDNPISGYLLYHKQDSGEWKETNISARIRNYTLQQLRCGGKYQFYVTAFNGVGRGDPSDVITAKTDGIAPVAPDKQSLLTVNSSFVILTLDTWHDGGCPITFYTIRYKIQREKTWMSVPSEVTRGGGQVPINELVPNTWYQLQVTAHNEAGSTEAEYSFFTQASGLEPSTVPSTIRKNEPVPFYRDLNIIIPTAVSFAVILVVVGLVCAIVRRRPSDSSHNGGQQYDSRKLQLRDSVQMSDIDKRNQKHSSLPGCQGEQLYYPAPYATTRLSVEEEEEQKKYNDACKQMQEEPLYATVKRLPRPPRSDFHIYHYPVHIPPESVDESLASVSHWKEGSVLVKIEEPPSEKSAASYKHYPSERSSKYAHR